MEKNIGKKLRGWNVPNSVFVIIRDQDSGDCLVVKEKLIRLCKQAKKYDVIVRIACRELESYYLGDLEAVEKGLGICGLSKKQTKSKFRTPDKLERPSEELEKLTKGAYQKVSGSRAIGAHLKLEGNRSHSFKLLLKGMQKLIGED